MLKFIDITKKYNNKEILLNANICLNKGEIVGLIGENGCGKTTTLQLLLGYISPESGTVEYNDIDIALITDKLFGFSPDTPPLYLNLTVDEYLSFIYDIKKCTLPKNDHLSDLKISFSLSEVSNNQIKTLSKGFKQRIGIVSAIIGFPPILIFDEPTSGLDPKQVHQFYSFLKNIKKDHIIILSSHIISDLKSVCDNIYIIKNKQIENINSNKRNSNLNFNFSITTSLKNINISPNIEKLDGVVKVKTKEKDNTTLYTIHCNKNIKKHIISEFLTNEIDILEIFDNTSDISDLFSMEER